jgi:preprotein translocase SecE subunit
MAVKNETKQVKAVEAAPKQKEKRNFVLEILSKEYKYENLFLMILSLLAIVLGILIINGTLVVNESFFIIGTYPMVFSWILVSLGVISLLLVIWPFYKPSFIELKRVTWLRRSEFLGNLSKVFLFILFLALMFFVLDLAISGIFNLLKLT